ncbi:MAG TPA: TRAP transporter fused permease subunit, partial [Limnochordales bacterium]
MGPVRPGVGLPALDGHRGAAYRPGVARIFGVPTLYRCVRRAGRPRTAGHPPGFRHELGVLALSGQKPRRPQVVALVRCSPGPFGRRRAALPSGLLRGHCAAGGPAYHLGHRGGRVGHPAGPGRDQARRGEAIVVIAALFLVYAYVGPYMPGFLAHRGYSLRQIANHMYYTTEGIFGIPLGVSATFIFLFILFGAFLEKTGIGRFFIDLANAVAGWASGGPAKVAVITSALEGTISGSSVANTVGSGSFTIPMMKRLGYKPEFAAAVEAAASTGGQIMPPIMGAAAFLMAEFTGIPYIEIAKAAVIPAILYFTGIFIAVHYEAKRLGLKGIPRSQLPSVWSVLKSRGHLF